MDGLGGRRGRRGGRRRRGGRGAAAGTNVGAGRRAGAGALIVESLPIVWASAVRGALQRLHSVRHWKLWLPQLAQSQSPGTYAAAPPATGPDGAAEITRFPPGGRGARRQSEGRQGRRRARADGRAAPTGPGCARRSSSTSSTAAGRRTAGTLFAVWAKLLFSHTNPVARHEARVAAGAALHGVDARRHAELLVRRGAAEAVVGPRPGGLHAVHRRRVAHGRVAVAHRRAVLAHLHRRHAVAISLRLSVSPRGRPVPILRRPAALAVLSRRPARSVLPRRPALGRPARPASPRRLLHPCLCALLENPA